MSFIERFLAGRDFVICRPDEHWHHPEDVPIPNELKDSYKIVDRCIIQRLTDRHVLVGLFSHDPSDVMDCHTSHWGYTTLRLYTTDDFCLSSATESVKLYDVENSGLSIPPRISRDFDPEVLAKALTVDKIASLLSTRWGDDQHGESRRGEELCCVKLTIPDEIWQEHIIWDKKRKGLTLTAEEQAMEREIIKKKNEENA